jgi:hypothetical protein
VILLAALAIGIVASRLVRPSQLTFQCSNCGNLTCEQCCTEEKDMSLCKHCVSAIENITSEKVIGALLRQKRQAAIVKRGRASRVTTRVLPGVRDIAYGRVGRAFKLSFLFSISLVYLISRGYVVTDTMRIVPDTPLWQIILPAIGVVLAFIMSSTSKPRYEFRTRRTVSGKHGSKRSKGGPIEPAQAA